MCFDIHRRLLLNKQEHTTNSILGTSNSEASASGGGILGGVHWQHSGGILGGIHWQTTLAGYWAGSTGGLLCRDTGRDTGRDPLADHSGGILGGIHWRTTLAGYWAGSTGGLL